MALTKEQVLEKMKEKNVVVLNVLSEDGYQKLHIPGSYNLPLAHNLHDFVQAVEKRHGKDKFFITHCSSVECSAGPRAAKALQEYGFKAEDYPGGIQDWFESGFPTEGILVRSTAAAS